MRFVLGGVAAVLVALGAWLRATAPEPVLVEVEAHRGVAVQVHGVDRVPLRPRIQVSGMVEARRQVELFAEQSGRVLEIGAERLDRVAEGQVLLRLDPLAAEVEVARAEASLAQAKSELDLARANLARLRNLASSRVSSEKDLDQAANDERVALATWRAADASLRDARDRLEKKTVIAPFAGVLREFPVEAGEYVAPGERVAELLELSRVRVEIGLRDREVVAVPTGASARVRAEARPGETFDGIVTRVAGAADPQTRKFAVQLEIENPEERLLPGMVAQVDLDLGRSREALLVPKEAVLDDFGLSFVYVVEGGGPDGPVARRRRIETRPVPFQPGDLEVTEGLAGGERIATTQLRQLADGVRVEPRTAVAQRRGGVAEEVP
ncbi:MAG: efflux RND transporter periplasmic adaptor subunit [Myxococcota bacterium]